MATLRWRFKKHIFLVAMQLKYIYCGKADSSSVTQDFFSFLYFSQNNFCIRISPTLHPVLKLLSEIRTPQNISLKSNFIFYLVKQ
jgi:hypothetical protein